MIPFRVGDKVMPWPGWKDDPNTLPTGVVRRIERGEMWARSMSSTSGERSRPMCSNMRTMGRRRSEMIAEAQEAGQAPTVQWYSLAEAKRMLEYKVAALPGGASHWFVPRAVVIKNHGAPSLSLRHPIDRSRHEGHHIELWRQPARCGRANAHRVAGRLSHCPVYREGKFGRERGEKRRQARALMAVSERAFKRNRSDAAVGHALGRGGR